MLYTTFSEESNPQIVIFKHLHWRSSSLCDDLILRKKSSVNTMLVSAKRTIKFNLDVNTFQSVNKQVLLQNLTLSLMSSLNLGYSSNLSARPIINTKMVNLGYVVVKNYIQVKIIVT